MENQKDWKDNPKPIKQTLDLIYLILIFFGIIYWVVIGTPPYIMLVIFVILGIYFIIWSNKTSALQSVYIEKKVLKYGILEIPLNNIQKLTVEQPNGDIRGELFQLIITLDGKRLKDEIFVYDIRSLLQYLDDIGFDKKKIDIPWFVDTRTIMDLVNPKRLDKK